MLSLEELHLLRAIVTLITVPINGITNEKIEEAKRIVDREIKLKIMNPMTGKDDLHEYF